MRLKLVVPAAVAVLVSSAATGAWAQKSKKTKDAQQEVVPDSINRQFQWEERVVGPKDGVDHKKIAALQEQGRREDEARKKEPPKKQARAEGIDAPASASLPTMDIEKPAPAGSVKRTKKVAAAEPPRQRDALDNLLSQETGKPEGFSNRDKKGGLGSILASDDGPAASARPAVRTKAKPAKRAAHRRRN